ncbi:unnamed protein product, partial [Ectocarpus sp. 4 AP-2014]
MQWRKGHTHSGLGSSDGSLSPPIYQLLLCALFDIGTSEGAHRLWPLL